MLKKPSLWRSFVAQLQLSDRPILRQNRTISNNEDLVGFILWKYTYIFFKIGMFSINLWISNWFVKATLL